MEYILTLAFVVILAIGAHGMIAQERVEGIPVSSDTILDVCPEMGSPATGILKDSVTHRKYVMTGHEIDGLFEWDASASIWMGYDSDTPMDQPSDALPRWQIKMWLSDGSERWMWIVYSESTPDYYYVYAISNVNKFADSNNEHYDVHPCRVFRLDASIVDDWLDGVLR